jgi:hypothetical protein
MSKNLQVPLPPRIMKDATITAFWANRVREAIVALANRRDPMPKAQTVFAKKSPFQVYGIKYDTPTETWKANVWPGHVLKIDPKYGVDEPIKYWLAPEFDTPPGEPFEFTVSEDLAIYAAVSTTNKDIVLSVEITSMEDGDAETEHHEPPPSAAENGESPPPPRDGIYYYKIADFRMEGENLVVDKQYHLGGPILHRPALHEFYNLPVESGGDPYAVVKHWNSVESRWEFRQLVQLEEELGIEVLKPLGDGEPPYDRINVRRIRERASGDDDSDATTQIRVMEAGSGNAVLVKGNSAVGSLALKPTGGSATTVLEWDDGLVTSEGEIEYEIPVGGKDVNLHVRKQTEGTGGNEWVDTNVSATTLCFRAGLLVGTISQSDPDALTEICVEFEESAPVGLISLTCSDIDPVS